ncbi:Dedicator of cytokinesis family protein [Histomonas meleagridis]|uniref:Dedicator of cytokinesis family protein n=1 Tax=Histomonas meleagridis TaxID=135588 RepID=UPI00355A9E10|nr:Dedicator of cytokinesis family protein [Histomonas meleagridis]KAH0799692.1 Dedicator of cytokinesis family protein [Histomonas meleagridis]
MKPSQLHSELDKWARENSELFCRHNLTASRLTISKAAQLWKPSGIDHKDIKHPGIEFFDYPAVIVTRNYAYQSPQKQAENPPQFSLFTYDESLLPEETPETIEDIVKVAPPLLSVFQKLEYSPLQDQRTDVGILKPGQLSYYTAKFQRLSSKAQIFEPIIVNLFLWDMDKQHKISQTWRFLPNASSFESFSSFISPSIFNAPNEKPLPFTTTHKRIEIIVSLDRLLVRSAGASLQKYYEKPNSSNRQAAELDIKQCNQKLTSITFAWSSKPYPKFSTGDPVEVSFDTFYATQTVSDQYLSTAFSQSLKHEKTVPFELTLVLSPQRSQIPPLRHYFEFPSCPYTSFINDLIIHPIQAHFRFPRGTRGRNILAEIQIIGSNNNPIPGFNGEKVYTTRCQYHVDSPKFDEDIVVDLPLSLPKTAKLVVFFHHASVKPKAKNPRRQCGCLVYPLFNPDGTFIQNGIHKAGISYSGAPDEIVPPTEGNQFIFSINLRSSIYTSDPQVNTVFQGDLAKLTTHPNSQLLLPHLYTVLDEIIKQINEGKYEGFTALVQILSWTICR